MQVIVKKRFANGEKITVARYPSKNKSSASALIEALEECAMMDNESASFEMLEQANSNRNIKDLFLKSTDIQILLFSLMGYVIL